MAATYALERGGQLTYRWLHPISLVLYGVLFERDPLPHADRIAESLLRQRPARELESMVDEIEIELRKPTQLVREILDNRSTEKDCREFLAAVAARVRAAL